MANPMSPAPAASSSSAPVGYNLPTVEAWQAVMFDRMIILIALVCIGIVIFRVGSYIATIKDPVELEVRKIRFAAVTFTGIMVLLVFVSLLYFLDRPGSTAGAIIFEKTLTALTPLAGAIIGYLFGGQTRTVPPTPNQAPPAPPGPPVPPAPQAPPGPP